MDLVYKQTIYKRKTSTITGGGINDMDLSNKILTEDGSIKSCPIYDRWRQMLRRTTEEYWIDHPAYIGVSVCDQWKFRSNFHNWMIKQERWWEFHLDKDILDPSNKIYSPDKCVLVPQYINSLLTDRARGRGLLPLGVTYRKENGTYSAQCNINGVKSKKLGRFSTPEEAHAVYQIEKSKEIMRVATKALDAGDIDDQVFSALVLRAKKLEMDFLNGVITKSVHHF